MTEMPFQTIGSEWLSERAKGNAPKERMIAECTDRGYFPKGDNEADAIAILHYSFSLV